MSVDRGFTQVAGGGRPVVNRGFALTAGGGYPAVDQGYSLTAGGTPPVAPTLALGTATSTTQPITITGGSGATSWALQYALASSGSWATFSTPAVGAGSDTVTGLTASTSYDYRLVASNAYGSTNSAAVTGSTAAGGAEGATFDYYIAATGDDNNAGSLASPWSITALHTKQATYRGKRVGLLGSLGTITSGRVGGVATTLYSMLQAGAPGNFPIIRIDGGTSGTPTYIGSSGPGGGYVARTALIDASNPAGGAITTVDGQPLLGQHPSDGGVTNFGYVEIQGIKLRGYGNSGLFFYASVDSLQGLYIHDNEIYDGLCISSNNNPGAIWLQSCKLGASGANANKIHNNYIHDNKTVGGSISPHGMYGVMTFLSRDVSIKHNRFVNTLSIYGKDYYQDADIQYNYIDQGDFGSAISSAGTLPAIRGFIPDTGRTTTIKYNVIVGSMLFYGGDALKIAGTVVIDHNTFYMTQNGAWAAQFTIVSGSRIQFSNNLVYFTGTLATDPGTIGWWPLAGGVTPTIMPNCDYNAYVSGALFSPELYVTSDLSIASWKAYAGYGFDAHCVTLSATPFAGTPTTGNVASFTTNSLVATQSSTGGKIGHGGGAETAGTDW